MVWLEVSVTVMGSLMTVSVELPVSVTHTVSVSPSLTLMLGAKEAVTRKKRISQTNENHLLRTIVVNYANEVES